MMMKRKNNNIDVNLIIKEIKENLSTGKEMTYVKSLNIDKNYKEKEIKKIIKQSKKRKIINFFKKILFG